MSAKVTIWAWKVAKTVFSPKEGPLLLTFLALADMARDHGKVWASHAYIAGKACQSPRTVRGNVEELERRGLLRTVPTPGRPDVIWLTLTAIVIFDAAETDEPGALEKGPRRPRHEMPTSGSAPVAEGVGTEVALTPAGRADKPRTEPDLRTQEVSARGARLPEGWEPDLQAATLIGLSDAEARAQAERFKDYWLGVPGSKGRKTDWPATWRNWCRRAAEEMPRDRGSPASSSRPDRGADQNSARVEAMLSGGVEAINRRRRWTLGG